MRKLSLFVLLSMLLLTNEAIAQFQLVANDDFANRSSSLPIQICVLDNDTPQNVLDPNTLTILTPPFLGNVEVVGDCIMYYPTAGTQGTDKFTYQICEPSGQCDQASVTLQVEELDDEGVGIVPGQLIVDYGSMTNAQIDVMREKIKDLNGVLEESCNCDKLELWSFTDSGTISTEEKKKTVSDTIGPASGGAGYNYANIFIPPNVDPECISCEKNKKVEMPKEVVTGIVDSGTDFGNATLHSSYWPNTSVVPCQEGTNLGYNALDETAHPKDKLGHGLHVAGLAYPNNSNSKLLIAKVIGDHGHGTLFETICGLHFAVNKKVQVVNMSLGYYGEENETFKRAIRKAEKKEVIVVCSAGNEAKDIDNSVPHWPSNFKADNIITVAAMDNTGHLADFSNYGNISVDVGAPGVNIKGESLPAPQYTGIQSGTSMSAGIVSREIAILRSQHMELHYQDIISMFYKSLPHAPALVGKSTQEKALEVKKEEIICYCLPRPRSKSGRNYIAGFALGGINNMNTGTCNGPAYSDYLDMRGTLLLGKKYEAKLKAGNGNCLGNTATRFEVWIDYDVDGKFSKDERLGYAIADESGQTVSITFEVPKDVPLGFTRLRVRSASVQKGTSWLDPCEPMQNGEMEDYTVNIVKFLRLSPNKELLKPINPKFKLKDRQ